MNIVKGIALPEIVLSNSMNGKFERNNKIVLEDETWDRKLIYNFRSSNYKKGFIKMFKEDRIFPWTKL